MQWKGFGGFRVEEAFDHEFTEGEALTRKFNRPRQVAAITVTATIEQAAETTKADADKDRWCHNVCEFKEIDFLDFTEEQEAQVFRRADHRSVQDHLLLN